MLCACARIFQNFQNMADAAGKVCVGSEKTITDLHDELKGVINRKLDEKDWSEDTKNEFRRQIFKV